MITLRFTEASRFQNALLTKNFQIPIRKRKLFIGRGEELQEKQSSDHGIIDLTNFDSTLSRVHACVNFSPAWFFSQVQKVPHYLLSLKFGQQKFPPELAQKVWEFLRPKKSCILKDLKSKVGIFKKLQQVQIKAVIFQDRKEMIIQFVHQSFINFHYYEKYETLEELIQRVDEIKKNEQKSIIFGDLKNITQQYHQCLSKTERKDFLKIWRFSIKDTQYILLIQNDLILRIGRSSHCEIQVKDTAISRYQAYLKCQQRKWKIIDGNPIEKSKNGTWIKSKTIPISLSPNQNSPIKNYVKIGTIKCEIQVLKMFEWLNIQKIVDQDTSKSFIQIGMENQDQGQKKQKEDQ